MWWLCIVILLIPSWIVILLYSVMNFNSMIRLQYIFSCHAVDGMCNKYLAVHNKTWTEKSDSDPLKQWNAPGHVRQNVYQLVSIGAFINMN